MKKYLLSLLVSLPVWHVWAQDHSYSLRSAIDYALENHNSIKENILDIADASSNIKEFTAIGMPKVNGSIQLQHFIDVPTSIIPAGSFFAGDPDQGIAPNPPEDLAVQFGVRNNLNAGLSADVLLFDGSFFVGLQAAKLYKELITRQSEVTREELATNVAKAYLGVISAQKNKELLSDNIRNLEKTLDESNQIYEQGFIEKLDVDRLVLSLNNLNVEEEKVNSLIEVSKNVLKFSMGIPIETPIEVTDKIEEIIVSEYDQLSVMDVQYSLDDRSEYIALQTADQLNELNIKRIKYQYLPVLRGFGSYSQILQGNQLSGGSWFPTTIVGLTLQVPIFDGFDKAARMDRAKIARDKHLLQMDNLDKAISMEVKNAKLNYLNALKTLSSANENEELAQDIYDTALIKYREGVGSSFEVTQAERDLYTSQGNYINALYGLLIAKIDLEKAMGTLLNLN